MALKQQLELYVERVQDADPGLQKVALESMRYFSFTRSLYFSGMGMEVDLVWDQGVVVET